MPRRARYADEFVRRYSGLLPFQRRMVEGAVRLLLSADDPTLLANRLGRGTYSHTWSHRVRANLLLLFSVSQGALTFLSTGTHPRAFRPA